MIAVRDYELAEPVQTYPTGRRCKERGCNTLLSVYNPSEYCALHDTEDAPYVDPAGEETYFCHLCEEHVPLSLMRKGRAICRLCDNAQRRAWYRGARVKRAWEAEPGYLRCTDCGEVKLAHPDNFRVDPRKPDFYKRCRKCEAKRRGYQRMKEREQRERLGGHSVCGNQGHQTGAAV